jgi:methyl-accepting chemotaxis protein
VVEEYRRHFLDWVDTTQLAQTMFNRLNAGYLILSKSSGDLRRQMDQRAAEARQHRADINAERQWFLFATLAGVVALSVLMAATLGRQISRQISQFALAMRNLAAGSANAHIATDSRIPEWFSVTMPPNGGF